MRANHEGGKFTNEFFNHWRTSMSDMNNSVNGAGNQDFNGFNGSVATENPAPDAADQVNDPLADPGPHPNGDWARQKAHLFSHDFHSLDHPERAGKSIEETAKHYARVLWWGFQLSDWDCRQVLDRFLCYAQPDEERECFQNALRHHDGKPDFPSKPRGWRLPKEKKELRDPERECGPGEEDKEYQEFPTSGLDYTDIDNAKRLVDIAAGKVAYVPTDKDWAFFDEGRWKTGARVEIEAIAKQITDRISLEGPPLEVKVKGAKAAWQAAIKSVKSKARTFAAIDLARSEPGVSVDLAEFDTDPCLINCINGTLHLPTGELRPHNPADKMTKMANVGYYPEKAVDTVRWQKFEREIFKGDQDLISYTRRLAGYAISGLVSAQEMYIFIGAGSNGKNVWLETIRDLLGSYGYQGNPKLITKTKNEKHLTIVTDLHGRRVITISEMKDGEEIDDDMVKRLTGDGLLNGNKMHKDSVNFKATHKMFLATNEKPVINSNDFAIRRRIRMIPFTTRFVDPTDPDMPPINPPHVLPKDEGLLKALEAEREGIFALMVQGFLDWQRDGMRAPDSVRAETELYMREMDPLNDFLESDCTIGSDLKTPCNDLREAYFKYCRKSHKEPMSPNKFGRELTKKGIKRDHLTIAWFYTGISLANPSVKAWLAAILKTESNRQTIISKGQAEGVGRMEIFRAKDSLGVQERGPFGDEWVLPEPKVIEKVSETVEPVAVTADDHDDFEFDIPIMPDLEWFIDQGWSLQDGRLVYV